MNLDLSVPVRILELIREEGLAPGSHLPAQRRLLECLPGGALLLHCCDYEHRGGG